MKRTSILGARLSACADMVTGDTVADIGTDHGLLPIYLVESGKCKKAYACDIAKGPLLSAEKNIRAAGLFGTVETVLSDGFEGIRGKTITDAVIAGMGGEQIMGILSRSAETARGINLVLQPNSRAYELISWLYENGFTVKSQAAVRDGKFIYPVINAIYCGNFVKIGEAESLTAGLDIKKEASKEYIELHIKRLRDAAAGLMMSKDADNAEKAEKFISAAVELEKIITEGNS